MVKKFLKKFPKVYSYGNNLLLGLSRYLKTRKVKYLIWVNKNNIKIVVGSSGKYSAGWIPTEIDYFNILNPKHWNYYFDEESIYAILAEHVWEHLTEDDSKLAVSYCYRYLKPGGYIRLAVPDGNHPDKDYINKVKPGGTGAGSKDHKILYDYELFSDLFVKAGFNVKLLEYFDSSGQFNFIDWDVRRGKIRRSAKFDERNKAGGLKYTSIVMDAYK